MPIVFSDQDRMIFTDTLYGEARGEYNSSTGGMAALLAVGCVIRNRLRSGKHGATLEAVCKQPKQFSCWNETDPNRALLLNPKRLDDIYYSYCKLAVDLILRNEDLELTKGALNYYAISIPAPYWAKGMKPTVKIGNHIFLV